ncbi:zinc ion binding [Myotisia sp. PD_48]|nr:zinc ion binding [Myotisia sp. PD_48]
MAPMSIPTTMRAWRHQETGSPIDILSLTDIPVPTLESETSVLIRVSHVALHPGTRILLAIVPKWLRKLPAIAETDFSGVVVHVSDKNPSGNFPPGTPVFGSIPVSSHLRGGQGALAEYIAIESSAITQKPSNSSFAQAAGLSVSAQTAVVLVDSAKIAPNSKVLINAPCGGVGHFAIQLLRKRNPTARIIGICSAANHRLAKELGCDDTIDYTSFPNSEGQTLTAFLGEHHGETPQDQFDHVFDAHGNQDLWEASPKYLKSGPDHPFVTVGPKAEHSLSSTPGFFWKVIKNSLLPVCLGGVPRVYKQVVSFSDAESLAKCRDLAQAGEFMTHAGESWSMEQALDAYRTAVSGHSQGKLVVKIWEPQPSEYI